MTHQLDDFEGKAVRQVGIEMPGAAGGLRDAMKVAPEQFLQGEEVWIAINARVAKVRHEPIDSKELDGDQRRVHVLNVEGATFVDAQIVQAEISEMQERIARGGIQLRVILGGLLEAFETGEILQEQVGHLLERWR